MKLPLDQAIPRFQDNEERMDIFANGNSTAQYTSSGGSVVPSVQKFLSDKDTEINVGATSILTQATTQANNASASAATATTQAGIATTKASEASQTLVNVQSASASIAATATAAATAASAASAASAATSANNAALSSGAVLWVSGTTYTLGQRVISPANNYVYRRTVAGAGTTDPSADAVNWKPDALEIDTGLPAIRPSFMADFAAVDLLDPRFGFSRATTGTVFDANGVLRTAIPGVPRFDHDPVTGAPLGLLIEPPATNLLTWSEAFDNAAWTKYDVTVTPNAATAPDGTMTADKLVATTGTSFKVVRQSYAAAAGFALISAKAAELDKIWIGTGASGNFFLGSSVYDINTGARVTSTEAGGGAVTLLSTLALPDGWREFRVSVPLSASHILVCGTTLTSSSPQQPDVQGNKIAGDGTSGIYLWGAQIATKDTSYIPTTSAQVTRAADSATISGANFSSWFRQDEGTVFVDFVPRVLDGSVSFIFGGGTTFFHLIARVEWQFTAQINGSETAVLDAGTPIAGQPLRLALTYSAAGFALSMNGGTPVSAASAIPIVNQLQLVGSMTVRRLTYYPKRLTNGQLQALTA